MRGTESIAIGVSARADDSLGLRLQAILTGQESRRWRAESVPRPHPYFIFTRQIAVRGGLVDGNVAGK
jgi:hypothetical protein